MKSNEYFPHTEPSFMADELLPCPFCGADPELIFIGNGYTKIRKAQIKCPKCRIQRIDATIKHSSEWVAKAAINHWNERHQAKSAALSKLKSRDVSVEEILAVLEEEVYACEDGGGGAWTEGKKDAAEIIHELIYGTKTEK